MKSKVKTDLDGREQFKTVESLAGNERVDLCRVRSKKRQQMSYLWLYSGKSSEIEKSWT